MVDRAILLKDLTGLIIHLIDDDSELFKITADRGYWLYAKPLNSNKVFTIVREFLLNEYDIVNDEKSVLEDDIRKRRLVKQDSIQY